MFSRVRRFSRLSRMLRTGLVISMLGARAIAAADDATPADPDVTLRARLAEQLSTSNKADTARVTNRDKGGKATEVPKRGGKPMLKPKSLIGLPWAYSGDAAPEHWAELKPENKLCKAGSRQSPIDIHDTIKVDQAPIRFDYKPGNFSVLDNGHTIEVDVAAGDSLQVMGRRYELKQIVFQHPAEERIKGRSFDLGVHLIHKDADGHLAIVAVLLDQGLGAIGQSVVQQVLNNLPLEKGQALAAQEMLDLNQLLPDERGYMTYMGSITTPPCTEGVLWLVLRQPQPVSASQLAIFTKLYPLNARTIQASAGRLIKESQ